MARSGSIVVEGAGVGETFERLLVDLLGIDAAREIAERTEGAAVRARVRHRLRLRGSDALDGAERIEDRRPLGVVAHVEIGAGAVD